MTVLTIDTDKISESACKMVRLSFNPSGSERVTRLKILAAALIAEYEVVRSDTTAGAREAAIAITHVQTASMMGVAAATADL